MRLVAFLITVAALCGQAFSQDYAREGRWKSEVLGNLVVGDAVEIALPESGPGNGRRFLGLYTEGKRGQPAVLVVHGSGVHPDHGVIGVLRVALADMGFSTLAIQMPVLAADASAEDYFPELFPESSARIAAAHAWLREKGHEAVVLASHSLGAWMAEHHLRSKEAAPFAGWVSMGRGGPIALPAASSVRVLDVYGEADFPAVLRAAPARAEALKGRPGSRQIVIPSADHFYTGREGALAEALRAFIQGAG